MPWQSAPMDDTATTALIDATSQATNDIGGPFYFSKSTLAAGKERGLDGMRWYVLGRGGVLGDVEAPVIQSAFGYFSPAVIDKLWNSAREQVAPREAGTAYMECCAEIGRERLGDVDPATVGAYNEAAAAVIAAADPAAYALFAGIAAEPLADDAPGKAMQQMAVLRELRGGAHLVALLASGLTPRQAHAVKRPDDVATFGWDGPGPMPEDAAERHVAADALTTQLLVPAYSVLDDDGAAAFEAGTAAVSGAVCAG